MKTFAHMLQEFPHDDKIDNLRHATSLSPKRQKQLSIPLVHFEDFDYDIWQGQYPPSNTSFETFNELKHLQSLQQYRDDATEDMIKQDKGIIGSFEKYLDEHELDVDMERIQEVFKESGAIVLALKQFYDRPRPKKLAKVLGIKLTEFQLKTAETSSYPSGHAVQGRLLSKLIADEIPSEHRANILDIGNRIGYYRQVAGAHYDSDTVFGYRLADELYRTVKIPVDLGESKLFISEGKMEPNGEDLFKRNNKAEFIAKAEKGELVDIKGNTITIQDRKAWNKFKKSLKSAGDETELIDGWKKAKGLHAQALGVIHSAIDKIANGFSTTTGKNPKGEDWESIIAVAVNGAKYKYKKPKKWMEGPEWKRAEKFWPDWEIQAKLLAKEFTSKLKVNELKQLGASTLPTSAEWKGKNKTPKTDLQGGGHNISLKKAGGSQLMSAGSLEAISTVEAAMRRYSLAPKGKKKINSLLDNLENKMIKLSQKGTVDSINQLRKKKKLTAAEKKRIKELDQGEKYAKELTQEMENLFNSEQLMKDYFCWEAATGETKFGKGSDGVASNIVTFKESGQIIDILQLKLPDVAGKDLATGNDFYVSFKSSSGSPPYLALRSKKVKLSTESADYQPTFAEIVQEECQKERVGLQVLNESRIEQLNEWQMISKLWSKTKDVAKKVVDSAKKILKAILERIKSAMNWIKKQGRKILDAVLNFFGLDMSIKNLKGGGKYPIV